jgi:hypothetical protein
VSAPGKAVPLAVGFALVLLPAVSFAQSRQLEIGVETFAYRSATTPLNRENVLGLGDYPGLGRLALGWRETHGSFRAVLRGYVERTWGTQGDGVPALDLTRRHRQVAGSRVGRGADEDDARPRRGRPVEPRGESPLLLERGVERVLRWLEAVRRVPGEA